MHYIIARKRAPLTTAVMAVAVVLLGVSMGSVVNAAPPQTVTYVGTPVTKAAPGKPFNLKFRVKNTGNTTYSGVKVIFHIPDGLTYSTVAPDSADIDENTITWTDVPLEPDQSFYPSFTFTLDSGKSLGSKTSIWVQVTGDDMEETSRNFSVIAVPAAAVKKTTLSSTDVSTLFYSVYLRTPTTAELKYWLARRTDKPTRAVLLGAMAFHKANNITHK